MSTCPTRRNFLKTTAACLTSAVVASPVRAAEAQPLFKISLAEWSLHRTLFGGKLDNLDFAKTAKVEFGIDAVEYVNQFFKDKAKDASYLAELKKRAEGNGVKSLLIMIDGERLPKFDNPRTPERLLIVNRSRLTKADSNGYL